MRISDWSSDVCSSDLDSYGRFRLRLNEMHESLKIIEQAADRLARLEGAPIMVADKKIAWPAQPSIGSDGMGNSLAHIRHIMRSEERRGGKECVHTGRSRGSPYNQTKNKKLVNT